MKHEEWLYFESPIGTLRIVARDGYIIELNKVRKEIQIKDERVFRASWNKALDPELDSMGEPLKAAAAQLTEYFQGERKTFDLPLMPDGTDFQKKVWRALEQIPYGQTRTYGQIAGEIGNPKACRAVGGANNKNHILIVIPCHRVIGSTGRLVGFGAGLEVKEYLLKMEKGNL